MATPSASPPHPRPQKHNAWPRFSICSRVLSLIPQLKVIIPLKESKDKSRRGQKANWKHREYLELQAHCRQEDHTYLEWVERIIEPDFAQVLENGVMPLMLKGSHLTHSRVLNKMPLCEILNYFRC